MKWISIKDRLPETTDNVLVCNFLEYAGCCNSFTVAYYNKKGWHPVVDMLTANNYDGGAVIDLDEEVTHWMPLLKPPSSHNSDKTICSCGSEEFYPFFEKKLVQVNRCSKCGKHIV